MPVIEDLDKGGIYLIRNKFNGKSYVGQARKYISANNNCWGTEGLWKPHLRKAFSYNVVNHCFLLNNAIRMKYQLPLNLRNNVHKPLLLLMLL